jgi:hypothetical protein
LVGSESGVLRFVFHLIEVASFVEIYHFLFELVVFVVFDNFEVDFPIVFVALVVEYLEFS